MAFAPPGLVLSSHDATVAMAKKLEGNKWYTEGDIAKAAECYTEALHHFPEDDQERAYTLCNRAACFLSKSSYDKVIEDCTEALKSFPSYVKALDRRARAYEAVGAVEDALADWTACCVIESFKNTPVVQKLEKVLREASQQKALQAFQVQTNHNTRTNGGVYARYTC